MNNELSCHIVQDLLPNYIEELTSDKTNTAVRKHLESCNDCRNVYEQMNVEIDHDEKVPIIELKFLKKVKRTRLLAALLSIVLTLVLSYMIYTMEFKYTLDKSDLSTAITEFTAPFESAVNAYVLETKEMNGELIVSFKDQEKSGVYGIAVLTKGLNQKYRIVRAKIKSSDFSSVVQVYSLEIKGKPHYVVSGHNLSDDIHYYGLDFHGYTHPGYLSKDRIKESIQFDVKNQQFLEVYRAEEIDSLLDDSVKESLYHLRLSTSSTSLYDADGKEITELFINEERAGEAVSAGIGKAELFLIYVYIIIVIGVGAVLTRYFLT